jgi:hypothetical protein
MDKLWPSKLQSEAESKGISTKEAVIRAYLSF